jgi:drug/metabolite transporter (DMT)-like permease
MGITLIFDILGDFMAKKWGMENKAIFLYLLIFFYSVSGVLWGLSLRYGELSKGTMIINLLNVFIMIIIGVVVFKEDLTLPNKIGIALGLVSIYLIQTR